MNNLSEKEKWMFEAIGLEEQMKFFENGNWTFGNLLSSAVERCFIEGLEGDVVKSLRRCVIHFNSGKYRGEEMDRLIY